MFKRYQSLEKPIVYLILSELCLQLINAAFMLILNIYMAKMGYMDHDIAYFVSYRFLGVMLLAFPLGLYIKGKKLKPFFYVASFLGPVTSLLTIYAVSNHNNPLLYFALIAWGVSLTCLQVMMLPFIMRNAKRESRTEAISLNYATWSISTIISGLLIYGLNKVDPSVFDEQLLLQLFAIGGFVSIVFVRKAKMVEKVSLVVHNKYDLKAFDWDLIIKSLVPTLIIAVGAGLTIPFVNLFFYFIHGLDFEQYSLVGSFAAIIVAIAAIGVPYVKRNYGYKMAITVSQSLAVLALIGLASTEFINNWEYAVYIAIFCFVIRQPLMNMAGPMTSELVMKYVGERNQDLMSSLMASIWSGSWYFSSQIFAFFRSEELSYSTIFYITAGLYSLGVIWYYFLILDYEKRRDVNGTKEY